MSVNGSVKVFAIRTVTNRCSFADQISNARLRIDFDRPGVDAAAQGLRVFEALVAQPHVTFIERTP